MIQLEYHEKNGKDVSIGDTIRYFLVQPEMQEEFGDNIPNGYYQHQVGTTTEWVEEVYEQHKRHRHGGG